jgi:transcriptional regulator with XRE-family HTH domain
MNDAGYRLKRARLDLGLTFRDVERASDAIASAKHCAEYFLPISRLADIENHAVLPTIYRIYALCAIYHLSFQETLLWYGVDLSGLPAPASALRPSPIPGQTRLLAPADLSSVSDHWVWNQCGAATEGNKPAIASSADLPANVCYARVGSQDRTMDPLIPPGSLVKIDTGLRRILEWAWRHEFERPIYLVEHGGGFSCSWCSLHQRTLVLQPHPLSSCSPRTFRIPQQAEVRGQVVAVAISLRSFNGPPPLPAGAPTESADR